MESFEFNRFLKKCKTDSERILTLLYTQFVMENENEEIFFKNLLAKAESFAKEIPTLQDLTIQTAMIIENLAPCEKDFMDHMIKKPMLNFNKLNFKTLDMLHNSSYAKHINFPEWFQNKNCAMCGSDTLGWTRKDPGWCWYCSRWYWNLDEDEFRYLYPHEESDDPEELYADAMGFKPFNVVDENGYSTDEYLEDTPDIDN